MSDLVFDVVGAQGPRRYFESLTRAGLAHAYLFAGDPGVGKKTFARRLAQSLLCEGNPNGAIGYDGTCRACALFGSAQSRHPDFLEHNGVMKIGDADAAAGFYEEEDLTARDLVRQLSMQSYEGGMRVLLLGDIEFATHHAANALLKFLEEPPRGVLMILTTSAPGRLLQTIRSRLIDVRFPLLSSDAIGELLVRRGYSEADARRGAALGGGSVTRAIAALEGDEDSLRSAVARWFFESASGRSAQEGWASRETLDEGLQTLKTLVRDWIVSAAAPQAPRAAPDQSARLGELPALRGDAAAALLEKLDEAARLARTNVSPAMVAEIARMAIANAATKAP